MASKEDIYVSMSLSDYKTGKSTVLESQANLLRSMRHINNLKVLARKKNDLKIRLQKILSSTIAELETIQSKMPTAKLPKLAKEKNEKKVSEKKSSPKKYDSIDRELNEIKAKLNALNATV